ncbi:aspartate/glutamate racemase family protein [Saccharopolyspora sp. MS10]|uniref:aspartate/glutamate racemase family protein n=1 Tax=Saccharopolyspora sp. MS10 TaxID=3385973 RepID=UPI00399F8672
MLVRAVTPIVVGPQEVARRQARYDALSPAGVRVVLSDLPPGGPRALNTADDIDRSTALVAEALAAVPDCDAVLPDCVLDPAIPARGGTIGGRPALGLLRLTVGAAVAAGHRIGAVTRNEAIAAELRRRVTDYGWADAFGEAAVLDLTVDDITDAARWSDAMRHPLRRAAENGTTAVINGCSAVETAQAENAPLVLDPIRTALGVLGALT